MTSCIWLRSCGSPAPVLQLTRCSECSAGRDAFLWAQSRGGHARERLTCGCASATQRELRRATEQWRLRAGSWLRPHRAGDSTNRVARTSVARARAQARESVRRPAGAQVG
eukprot:4216741-Prymnesium_polylepis.2